MNNNDIWNKVLEIIKKELNPVSFSTWFGETKFYEIDDQKVTLLVPMPLHKRILLSHYYKLISDSFYSVTNVEREIDCVIEEEIAKNVDSKIENIVNNLEVIDNEFEDFDSNLNPNLTFNNFVVGNSNKFARTAAFAVAENPGTTYNPLFIYGKSGIGKTHLMHAIGNYIVEHNPKLRVLYTASEEFRNDYTKISEFLVLSSGFKINSITKTSEIISDLTTISEVDYQIFLGQLLLKYFDNNNNEIKEVNTNKVIKFDEINKNSSYNDKSIIITKSVAHHSSQKSKSKDLISKGKSSIKLKKSTHISSVQMTMNDGRNKDDIRNFNNITSLYTLIKREHSYLRVNYNHYISKQHPNCFATILADIFDKIYLIKTLLLLRNFDIFSVHLSLYLFYHISLLSLICLFFTVKTIRRIWEEPDFPTRYFYLLYGFIANVIIWVIYKIFIYFLDNEDGIRILMKINKENVMNGELIENIRRNKNKDNNNEEELKEITSERYEALIRKIKIKTAVFYIIILIITGACSIYLLTFSAFYTGTKRYVIKTYYISIIEIVIIKFIAGLCLGYLRVAAERNEIKCLYNLVYFFDKYLS